MTRPFSTTMQAHRLDLHRLWLVLLVGSILMVLLWVGWASTDTIVDYESSDQASFSARGPAKTTVTEQGNVARVKSERERFVEARFPAASRASLMAGQKADVFLRGRSGADPLAAVVIDVQDDERDPRELRVTLRLLAPEDQLEPALESAPPERVRIAVRTSKPIDLVLPRASADAGSPPPGSGPVPR